MKKNSVWQADEEEERDAMKGLIDCFEFCLWSLTGRLPLNFEEFEPPQGECHCRDVEDLIDLEDAA